MRLPLLVGLGAATMSLPMPALAGAASSITAAALPPSILPAGDATDVRAKLEGWRAIAASRAEPLLAPVGAVPMSSHFGFRADPFNGITRRHDGIDLPGMAGTPVHAAADGTVAHAGRAVVMATW